MADRLFNTRGSPMDIGASAQLREELKQATGRREMVMRYALVQALLQEGRNDEAVAEIETTFQLFKDRPGEMDPRFHRARGLAYLRLAEQENCVKRHNRDCCLFPLRDGGVHAEAKPAQAAAEHYLAYLRMKPDDLDARWLLNIAHMAMGTYPDSVPAEFLIPQAVPGEADDFPRFTDVAMTCGITRMNHAGAAIIDDFDGDGLPDIVLSNCAPDGGLTYYHNAGTGVFEDRSAAARVQEQWGSLNTVSTDYDNDGDMDLLVLRGAWLHDNGRIRRSLLRNDGRGVFEDVTHAAGLAEPAFPSQTAAWFDYDNDGDLDVFIGHESRKGLPPAINPQGGGDFPSCLFRNNNDGTFTDVAAQAGVTNDRFCKGAAAGDYDGDGWIDLYVSNIGPNRLYRNNGDGTFTDQAERLGLIEPVGRSFATWFFDFDNDSHLDIFVGGYDVWLADEAAWRLGRPFRSSPPRLYRNKGDGTFEDVTQAVGLWRPMQPMGANFGDVNNDSFLDIYLATGNPDYEGIVPNVMFRNAGGRSFEDVTVAGGFGNLQKGHGVAFADLDHDGDQDVFSQLGGFYRGDAFYNALYENPGGPHHFVTLKLIGTRSNRLAYGARITVHLSSPSGDRIVHRAVGSVSSFGGSPARQEIGLGDATAIDAVDVWWPASGIRQKLTGLHLDSFYEITEGDPTPVQAQPPRFKLGRSDSAATAH